MSYIYLLLDNISGRLVARPSLMGNRRTCRRKLRSKISHWRYTPRCSASTAWQCITGAVENAAYERKKAPHAGLFYSGLYSLFSTAYFAVIKAIVVSSMRFEKPHSLSYHDETLTKRPETLVKVASKLLDAGLWLKSTDTKGSV